MMNKKCYAHIKTSQEIAREIQTLTDEVMTKGVTVAYKNIKAIKALNDKFLEQFGDTDPEWQPSQARQLAPNMNYAKR